MTDFKRLHISPLTPQSLSFVLRPPTYELASEISFHAIETCAEKNFGYVTLPVLEADRLRNKLNGSILRGVKIRVEEARPKRSLSMAETDDLGEVSKSKKGRKSTKSSGRSTGGVLEGVELPSTRKVRRGWAEPEGSTKEKKNGREKKAKKSKSTTGKPECLFKTTVPPNARAESNGSLEKNSKSKKRKRTEPDGKIMVHEFTHNTRQATFLKAEAVADGKKPASEFVEGKGWVNENGEVVEAAPVKRSKPKINKTSKKKVEAKSIDVNTETALESREEEESTSSSGSSDPEGDTDSDSAGSNATPPTAKIDFTGTKLAQFLQEEEDDDVGSNVESSGDDRENSRNLSRMSITRSSPPTPPNPGEDLTKSSTKKESKAPHPLELLFKRPPPRQGRSAGSSTPSSTGPTSHSTHKKPPLPPPLDVPPFSTSKKQGEAFTFFDSSDPAGPTLTSTSTTTATGPPTSTNTSGFLVPQTPLTQQDIRYRRQRSAAPTPDTALPGRTFADFLGGLSDVGSSDDNSDGDEKDDEDNDGQRDDDMDISENRDIDHDDLANKTKSKVRGKGGKSAAGAESNTILENAENGDGEDTKQEEEKEEEQSEFVKWFYEHRGENNRAWKRRRREKGKEEARKKRQEESGGSAARQNTGGAVHSSNAAAGASTRRAGRGKK